MRQQWQIGVFLCLLACASGCSKKQEEAATPAEPDAPSAIVKVLTLPRDTRNDLAEIQARQAIQAFQSMTGRFPGSLDELIQTIGPLPEVSAGYAYVLEVEKQEIRVEKIAGTPPDTPE